MITSRPQVVIIQQALARSTSRPKREGGIKAVIATGMEERMATVLRVMPLSKEPYPISHAIKMINAGAPMNFIKLIQTPHLRKPKMLDKRKLAPMDNKSRTVDENKDMEASIPI